MSNIDTKFTEICNKDIVSSKGEVSYLPSVGSLTIEDQKIYNIEFQKAYFSLLALQKQVRSNKTSFESKFYKLWSLSIVTFFLSIVFFSVSGWVRDYLNYCETNKCCYFFVCDKRVNYEK